MGNRSNTNAVYVPRIHIFIPVVGAEQETCYCRVKASKTGLFGKQVFVCVQILIELVEDQFFKNSRKYRENRFRPVVRPIISLSTFENRGNPSNFPRIWKNRRSNTTVEMGN